jgi:hypothetical protein
VDRTQEHLSNYIPVPEAGCWFWLGHARNGNLYGTVPLGKKGKKETASRFFYRHLVGPIPPGMGVCHRCDTPLCVNPDHLFLGTQKDNVDDMFKKGRNKKYAGVHNGRTRMTIEQVRQARVLRAEGLMPTVIAQRLGFPFSTVQDILKLRTWVGIE